MRYLLPRDQVCAFTARPARTHANDNVVALEASAWRGVRVAVAMSAPVWFAAVLFVSRIWS